MVHSMGDAFSDIYTFTAYENEMGELFLAEWLFDMGYFQHYIARTLYHQTAQITVDHQGRSTS